MSFRPELLGVHLAAVLLSTLIAVVAVRRPRLGRALFVLLFALASLRSAYGALHAPDTYLRAANLTESPVYRALLTGPFARHVVEYVLAIASAQALIALGLTMRGWAARAAEIAGVAFLVALAPLGVAAAFPASLILAGGLVAVSRSERSGSLPACASCSPPTPPSATPTRCARSGAASAHAVTPSPSPRA